MLFFGTGSGRCGTMTIANLLNLEEGTACLHEGKFRDYEQAGEQWLPFLTLQNLTAYHYPDRTWSLFSQARNGLTDLLAAKDITNLGDIAYNYAPFVGVIPEFFPDAKLLVIIRDGRDFVRSAYTSDNPDPTPVGWLDDRPLSKLERYIALGRLRPHPNDIDETAWMDMHPVEKNAWLWSETNRIIFKGLEKWKPENVLVIRFEEFFADTMAGYRKLRGWLGFTSPMPEEKVRQRLERKINKRTGIILPPPAEWDEKLNQMFMKYAGDMMRQLNYHD
jgi:hypothetical protein